MNINWGNNNDKITNYWKTSIKNQLGKKNIVNNTIKVSSYLNHEGKYEVDETTNINGKIFIKQYKYSKDELNSYLKKNRENYIIVTGDKNQLSNNSQNINYINAPNTNNYIHPEYRAEFNPMNSYKTSFQNKYN